MDTKRSHPVKKFMLVHGVGELTEIVNTGPKASVPTHRQVVDADLVVIEMDSGRFFVLKDRHGSREYVTREKAMARIASTMTMLCAARS